PRGRAGRHGRSATPRYRQPGDRPPGRLLDAHRRRSRSSRCRRHPREHRRRRLHPPARRVRRTRRAAARRDRGAPARGGAGRPDPPGARRWTARRGAGPRLRRGGRERDPRSREGRHTRAAGGTRVIEQIAGFRRRLQDAVAERVEPFAHGTGLFCDSIPIVYDANFVRVESVASAALHEAEADALMERFWHRRVITDAGGAALAAGFAELGWTQTTHVVMGHVREPDRAADAAAVREVPFETLVEPHIRVTLSEPHGTLELAESLLVAKRRVTAAVPTRFFATHVEGEVASYCELRSDGRTAQIEDVNTLASYRGRGLGRAVVQRALDEARTT